MSNPQSLAAIRRALSDPRLEGYRVGTAEDDLDLLARCAWNMALSGALWAVMQLIEVALRNALHDAITNEHGTPRWYEGDKVLIWTPRTRAAVDEALKVVAADPTASDAPGRVVAALDFGFWTTLLNAPYWSPTIAGAAPAAPLAQAGAGCFSSLLCGKAWQERARDNR